jgi:hypothetical protein
MYGVTKAEQSAAFGEAMNALWGLGQHTQDIANALQTTMQAIIDQRPDLANAKFDFVSKNGSLEVVSTDLSPQDKGWLTSLLNANTSLVNSVKAFNDDATTMSLYDIGAQTSPTPIADSTRAVSKQVDGSVKFISFLDAVGNDIQQTMHAGRGAYVRSDGGPLDLGQSHNTATKFLSYTAQMQAVQTGAINFEYHGTTYTHGMSMSNPYVNAWYNLKDFVSASLPATLGLSVKV